MAKYRSRLHACSDEYWLQCRTNKNSTHVTVMNTANLFIHITAFIGLALTLAPAWHACIYSRIILATTSYHIVVP